MRLRGRSGGISGKAAPDPAVAVRERLKAARLCVITPDAEPDVVVHLVEATLRGGADMVQLRQKLMPRGELLTLARRLRQLVDGALFVVNDHVDIALISGADGVHLGPDDLSIASARNVAGDRLIVGASASSIEAARAAINDGADYLGSGPAFSTPVKTEKQVIGPQSVAEISRVVGSTVPVFAIGGIDASNIAQLTALGVNRACVIRAVATASDPEGVTRRLRAMLESK